MQTVPQPNGEQPDGHGWVYDPEWQYFVHNGSTTQQIAIREAVEREPEWASTIGLRPETVRWLVAHPTPGAYRQR